MSSTGEQVVPAAEVAAVVVSLVVILVKIVILVVVCHKRARTGSGIVSSDTRFMTLTMDKFLNDMEREKPIRFTSQQLRIATDNFANLLGLGEFGSVYKGIFSNGTLVAVKFLYGNSDKRIDEQFMAEVSTIGRVHHLVRLFGFCFEKHLRALVYEYMGNGSLDKYLFHKNKKLGFETLHEIAVGTARGIAYLHEECQQRIIHYDIKPGNILLDAKENTHVTLTAGRGTPGCAAPEMWMPYPITHKCDIYSFGMLLFEILGRRRNLYTRLEESQEWLPRWVWKKFEQGELGELTIVCGIEAKYRETTERMVKVALWCVQYRPDSRPLMSVVVRMLEGAVEIPTPLNPFQHMLAVAPFPSAPSHPLQTGSSLDSELSTQTVTRSTFISATPLMRKYEIEIAFK
ncbi:hypothetical protein I3842_07G196100 [Carya illinoinensis]|uniref:Protein kinase domain-containing protein n=1 Tax=Carya illinoinensis TaxID=32201 RepID=A0A922EQE2_CARIL|nr:hypothetical protein I3842_07G196100 [Carya illinoinensis]